MDSLIAARDVYSFRDFPSPAAVQATDLHTPRAPPAMSPQPPRLHSTPMRFYSRRQFRQPCHQNGRHGEARDAPTLAQPAVMPDAAGTKIDAAVIPVVGVPGAAPSPARMPSSPLTPLEARTAFLDKLTRRAEGLLPVPAIHKRRRKSQLTSETPRRSRRLAGSAVEFQLGDLETRARKKVMRALDIIGENEGITPQAQDEYAKLFGHRPSASHIQATTALFSWSLPEDLGQSVDGDLLA